MSILEIVYITFVGFSVGFISGVKFAEFCIKKFYWLTKKRDGTV